MLAGVIILLYFFVYFSCFTKFFFFFCCFCQSQSSDSGKRKIPQRPQRSSEKISIYKIKMCLPTTDGRLYQDRRGEHLAPEIEIKKKKINKLRTKDIKNQKRGRSIKKK